MSAIESIIQDYTVGAQRDCYVGGRKIELAERARKELAELRARLARYEAQGPALLTAEHHSACADFVYCKCAKDDCDAAYREQHARCVAVVERMLREATPSAHARKVLRTVLAALTEGAKP